MKDFLMEFMADFDYPQEAQQVLLEAYDTVCANGDSAQAFAQLLKIYQGDMNCDYRYLIDSMQEISKNVGIHNYTGQLLLFICLAKQLKVYYCQKGVDLAVWKTSVLDLRCKLFESKLVHGVWGSFVSSWFPGFFKMTRFGLGRLQFELVKFERNYTAKGVTLTPDSTVINIHIPRTGTRLDRQSVKEAYALAAAFFKDALGEAPTVFVCGSWLLFPRHKEMLLPESNIVGFMNDFDIIESGLNDDYGDTWRLFDCLYNPDLDKMPQDSTLRRAYVELMRRGEKTGWGFGLNVYEG